MANEMQLTAYSAKSFLKPCFSVSVSLRSLEELTNSMSWISAASQSSFPYPSSAMAFIIGLTAG